LLITKITSEGYQNKKYADILLKIGNIFIMLIITKNLKDKYNIKKTIYVNTSFKNS